MKILLVDDEKTVRDVLSNFLKRKGIDVVEADSGSAALDVARQEKPDLVVSDVMMPNMDGFQFRRFMLEDPALRNIPLIFYSGKYVGEKSRDLAESLGVARFIRKPIGNEELLANIVQVIEEQKENLLPFSGNRKYLRDEFTESYQEILQERVFEAYQELDTAHETQLVINNLYRLALQDLTLEELLDGLLEQIISFPFYGLLSKGAIFISEGDELVLMTHRGMQDTLLETCGRLPYGHCLCGRSAESGEIVFADHVDERHDVHYSGIQPHGHYCVPIKTAGGKVLGVFTLYIQAGTARRQDVEISLESAAATAASIIMRKMNEEELTQNYMDLHALNQASSSLLYRDRNDESLHQYICHLACDHFNLKMVWLGILEDKEVRIAAAYGEGTVYLDSILIRCQDLDEGKGPTCRAINSSMPVACNDIESDEVFTPWRDNAMACGFRSSLAVPLVDVKKRCRGTLNMYSGTKNFFNPKKIELMTAYVNNVVALLDNDNLISNLEELVSERTVELETARNLAEAADRAKSSFLANMSHELRTPLNSIIGFADIMLQDIGGSLNPDHHEYVNDIRESGNHLLTLVNDILDLSKIEADMMELEYGEVNIQDVVTRSLYMFREKAIKHGIPIVMDIPPDLPEVEADERRLRQVIVNLLSNAIKFTPYGGKIRVVARLIHEKEIPHDEEFSSSGYVMVSVADTGYGISQDDQSRLFKPFVQLDHGISKKPEGTGLGLALSKRIVEQHKGRIVFASEPGSGSVFSFILPVKRTNRIRCFSEVFLPWPIFLQHIERISSMVSRMDSSFLMVKLEHSEDEPTIDWCDTVLAFNGQIRMHECFSLEPVGRHFYFLLFCNRSADPAAAIARLKSILSSLGITSKLRQAIFPDDSESTAEIFRRLGYRLR